MDRLLIKKNLIKNIGFDENATHTKKITFRSFAESFDIEKIKHRNKISNNKKVDKITSPYSALVTPQYQIIIDYLRGSISQPDPNIAGMGLTSFANSLKIDYSLYL